MVSFSMSTSSDADLSQSDACSLQLDEAAGVRHRSLCVNVDRETMASALVATGGAWLLGSVLFRRKTGRWNAAQLRGMAYAGVGFLMSAAAARWLQHAGSRGIAVSLVGTVLAMRGMYTLVRERAARRASEKPRTPE